MVENRFNSSIKNRIYEDIKHIKDEPAINHHLNNYNSVIPIWVIVNYVSFGTLIKIIECLTFKLDEFMKGAKYTRTKDSAYSLELRAIQMLRNKISHHSNILGRKSPYNIGHNKYSVYGIGFQGIYSWSKLLLNDNQTTMRITNEIHTAIENINVLYGTGFSYSLLMCKKIK